MSNAITCLGKKFAVKSSCILALISNLSNLRTILYAKTQFKVARCDESYSVFSLGINTNPWLSGQSKE